MEKKDYLELNIFLAKNYNNMNPSVYANETDFIPLRTLMKKGYVEISSEDVNKLQHEIIRISRDHEVFVFQLTIRTYDDKYYRYWFKDGKNYGVQGEVTFDDFRIENLK